MSRKTEIALLLAVLLLGGFFRFFLITEVPPGLYPDEAANGNNALEALRTGPPAGGFKIFYPENNGREGLFINLQAISVKLFGAEPWALRLVSAVFGTLTVLGVYLLTRELFYHKSQITNHKSQTNTKDQNSKPKTRVWNFGFRNWNLFGIWNLEFGISRREYLALLSAFFLATSYWHINFSRIGFRAVTVPFFAVFGAYWLLKALRTGKISSTVLAGLATGLGFHTYIAFRFMPFALAVPILAALAGWLRGLRPQPCVPCVVALFLFAAFLTALPLGFYFLQHPDDFFGRGGQISIFSAESPAYEFIKSTALTLGMFNIWGDCNQRHNLDCAPQLFWPVGILFLIGFGVTVSEAVKGLRRATMTMTNDNDTVSSSWSSLWSWSWFLLAWFFFLMLPATLTKEGLPHALRAIGLIPAAMIFAAIGGAWLWGALTGALRRAAENPANERFINQLRRIKKEFVIAAILILIWIPVNAYREYFIRFAASEKTADAFSADLWHMGQYLDVLPAETQKFVIVNLAGDDIRGVPAPAQTIMFANDTFDPEKRREKRMTYVRRPEDISIDTGAKVAIIPLNPRDRALIAKLKERFPALKIKVPGDFAVFENQQDDDEGR